MLGATTAGGRYRVWLAVRVVEFAWWVGSQAMPVVPAAEVAGRTRYSPEAQRLVVEALGMPAGDAKGAACVAARDALRRELLCCGKRPSEHALMGRVVRVTGP